MASLFIFNRSSLEEEEMSLGTPDLSEAQSLERHVDRCAMRYRLFTKRISSLSGSVKRLEIIGYGILVFLFVTSPVARDVVEFILKL